MARGADYYEILGVAPDASEDQIKNAYRKLARRYHPDKNPGDKAAEAKFKELSQAHTVLADPEQRRRYDAIRAGGFGGPGPGGAGGVDFEQMFGQGAGGPDGGFSFGGMGDILSSLFGGGGGGGGGRGRRPGRAARGEDTSHLLEIPFEVAVKGGTTHLTIPRPTACSACGGSGAATPADRHDCPDCRGTGHTQASQGAFSINRPCGRCLGRGSLITKPCATCKGSGQVHGKRKVSIEIPAGIETGRVLRVAGEGRPGPDGGPAGDLLIEVSVKEHGSLRRDGLNIVGAVDLRLSQLLRGATVEVETLHGSATLKVPPLTAPGARLRLGGQGIESRGQRGDHLVEVRLVLPRQLTKKQRELADQLGDAGL